MRGIKRAARQPAQANCAGRNCAHLLDCASRFSPVVRFSGMAEKPGFVDGDAARADAVASKSDIAVRATTTPLDWRTHGLAWHARWGRAAASDCGCSERCWCQHAMPGIANIFFLASHLFS